MPPNQRCGHCHDVGHNVTTCPKLDRTRRPREGGPTLYIPVDIVEVLDAEVAAIKARTGRETTVPQLAFELLRAAIAPRQETT